MTDAVHAEVSEWQNRPLEKMYPLVFFDALRVRIRDEGTVRNKAVYLALGVAADGTREVLGMWIEQNEGAKFWLKVMNELRHRGVEDVLLAVVDGLKGFPEAITAVFPEASVQTCIVHLIRHSLNYCNWKERAAVAAALKLIYRAASAEEAEQRLTEFEAGAWGRKYPTIAASWRRAWEEVIPFFAYPAEVRKIIYTTNAIESLNMQLRKVLKTRGHVDVAAAPPFGLHFVQSVSLRSAPLGRSGHQADVSGLAPHHGEMEVPAARLESRGQSICDPVRAAIFFLISMLMRKKTEPTP